MRYALYKCMLNTIRHLHNYVKYMRLLVEFLRLNGGHVILGIPNHNMFTESVFFSPCLSTCKKTTVA